MSSKISVSIFHTPHEICAGSAQKINIAMAQRPVFSACAGAWAIMRRVQSCLHIVDIKMITARGAMINAGDGKTKRRDFICPRLASQA
jgi:hypothetical protein